MFGFIIGTACLIGFISVWRHGSHRHFGRSLYWRFFRKLDTSPGQERIVRNAFESIKDQAREFVQGGKSARKELAELMRQPDFDNERVNDWFSAREQEFRKVRQSAVDALSEVHEVLDDRQRQSLAKLIEQGGHWHRALRHRGPYRHQAPEAS